MQDIKLHIIFCYFLYTSKQHIYTDLKKPAEEAVVD